jgi:hypothetical protein
MLTLADCIALSELTDEEVEAIAQHEHIPQLAAAELGNYLVRTPSGEICVKDMMRDDIAAATQRGDRGRVLALKLVIRDFIARHPCCEARHHPRPS